MPSVLQESILQQSVPVWIVLQNFSWWDESSGVYADSGLVTKKGKWDKKLAWYYVSCMTTVLENSDLLSTSMKNGIRCETFTDRINRNTIYCL